MTQQISVMAFGISYLLKLKPHIGGVITRFIISHDSDAVSSPGFKPPKSETANTANGKNGDNPYIEAGNINDNVSAIAANKKPRPYRINGDRISSSIL